jgi:hypothetical protein
VRSKAPLPSLHRSSPPFPCQKRKNTGKSWKYNAIHIHIKNYTYKVTLCVGTLSPRSLTACSRCTGSETLHWGSCNRPRTTREKKHLPHGSGIFPAARRMDDEWPFWYSIGGPPEGVRPRVFLNLRRTHK